VLAVLAVLLLAVLLLAVLLAGLLTRTSGVPGRAVVPG